jgi:TRAP-type C4-dicarboxylate transport system substrate-binding protein
MKRVRQGQTGVALVVLSIFMAVVLFLPSPGRAKEKQYEWKIGTLVPQAIPAGAAMFEFAELVEERTNGRIKMECFPVQQLGDWKDQFDNVMRGVQEMGFLPTSPRYQQFAPRFVSFVITDWEQYKRAYAPGGFMSELVKEGCDELGIKVLGHINVGFDGYSGMKGPVVLPGDVRKLGIKTRVGYPTSVPYWEELGPVVSIDMAEVYTALQLGTIDCQADMSVDVVYTQFRDVTKYFTDLNSMPAFIDIIINKKLWNKLPADLQEVLQETASEMAEKATRLSREKEESFYEKFEEEGVVVTRLTPEQREEWVKLAKEPGGLWDELRDDIGDEAIDWLLKNAR